MIDDGPAAPAASTAPRRGRGWPWAVAAAILAFLLWRTPLGELARAVERGPSLALVAYSCAALLVVFVADVWATRVALAAVGVRLADRHLVAVRGTTHLLGLVNFTAGQGTLAYYLVRLGTPVPAAAGSVLFLVAVSGLSLAALGVAGIAWAPPLEGGWGRLLVVVALAGIAGALAVVVLRPRWLTRRTWARPLFAAGRRGWLAAIGSRVAHLLVFALLYWGAVRIWRIPIPLDEALAIVVALMFVAAVPITPYGVGTVQAAQIVLFAPYLPHLEPAAREASILAFSLVHYAASMATQAALGFLCYLGWRRIAPAPPHP